MYKVRIHLDNNKEIEKFGDSRRYFTISHKIILFSINRPSTIGL